MSLRAVAVEADDGSKKARSRHVAALAAVDHARRLVETAEWSERFHRKLWLNAATKELHEMVLLVARKHRAQGWHLWARIMEALASVGAAPGQY